MTITWNHKPLVGSTPRPWIERRYAECAFPFDAPDSETLSCCLPVVGEGSYCSGHREVCYARVPQVRLR